MIIDMKQSKFESEIKEIENEVEIRKIEMWGSITPRTSIIGTIFIIHYTMTLIMVMVMNLRQRLLI